MATISDPPAATSLPAAAPETAHATTTTAATTQDARGPVGGLPAELDTATEPFPTTSGVTASPTEAASAKELASPASSTTAIPSKDDTNPLDFQGDVQTNNNLPAPETLRKLGKYTVLDESGKSHTFKSLYTGPNVARRVLIIFIRHFFCGVSHSSLPYPPGSALKNSYCSRT